MTCNYHVIFKTFYKWITYLFISFKKKKTLIGLKYFRIMMSNALKTKRKPKIKKKNTTTIEEL